MNVAFVNAVCGTGSTGSICEDLADELIKRGHRCSIYYGNGDSENPYAQRITSAWCVKWHALFSRVSGLQGYSSLFATYRLIGKIRREGFDIVHLHNLHGNYIHVPVLLNYLKKNRIPTVLTLHDCWFFTGKCTHYTECSCYKWKESCGNCPQLKKDIPSFFFDKTMRMLRDKRKAYQGFDLLGVIAVSDWIRNEAEQSILKDARMATIYNWVDLEKFYPRHDKGGGQFTVLGVSAKWTSDMPKYKDFIKLSKRLPQDCEIVLIGKMDPDIVLPDNVRSVPYVQDQNELASYYSKADVYVHLSREDSFGKVIVEAMACGTPVIVYNSTACPELVGQDCGFVAESGDVDMICDWILTIRQIGSANYREACIERAKNFEKRSLVEQTCEFYAAMVKSKQ